MVNIPVLRWGEPYESLKTDEVVHFDTGETVARVGQANAGLLMRDMRKAHRARKVLKEIPIADLVGMMKQAGELFRDAALRVGDSEQTPDDYARLQSASTGLPLHMAQKNISKNHFVLSNMDRILDCLTRGLPPEILTRGWGTEGRGVIVSYQAQTDVLGMVLPSNSPGVHTLWLPVIPLQVGLVLKPGAKEPWTPYRMAAAFTEAGIPKEAIAIYPGSEMGPEVVSRCSRVMIFGSAQTIDKYAGDPRVQVHGPGFSKILLGDDVVDDWEKSLDLMVDSIFLNSGRGCINCSAIYASRHTREISEAIAERLGPVDVKPYDDPEAALAAFTVGGQAQAIKASIEDKAKESGVTDVTTPKFGERLVEHEHCAYLRPWIFHVDSPERAIAQTEYMFPYCTVVECPQEEMIGKIGYTLVASAITEDREWEKQLIEAGNIDRLNIGPIPTIKLDWLQPHEGNIVDFLYKARAFQVPDERLQEAGG